MIYRFHPEALQEYQDAALYYAERDPALALRFVEAVARRVFAARPSVVIAGNPGRGRVATRPYGEQLDAFASMMHSARSLPR